MLDTPSLFDALEQDDTHRRTASRQALSLAFARVDRNLGRFLRGAVTEEEFEARLAAVQDDLAAYVAAASEECGHEHPEYIARSLVEHYASQRRWQPRQATPLPSPVQGVNEGVNQGMSGAGGLIGGGTPPGGPGMGGAPGAPPTPPMQTMPGGPNPAGNTMNMQPGGTPPPPTPQQQQQMLPSGVMQGIGNPFALSSSVHEAAPPVDPSQVGTNMLQPGAQPNPNQGTPPDPTAIHNQFDQVAGPAGNIPGQWNPQAHTPENYDQTAKNLGISPGQVQQGLQQFYQGQQPGGGATQQQAQQKALEYKPTPSSAGSLMDAAPDLKGSVPNSNDPGSKNPSQFLTPVQNQPGAPNPMNAWGGGGSALSDIGNAVGDAGNAVGDAAGWAAKNVLPGLPGVPNPVLPNVGSGAAGVLGDIGNAALGGGQNTNSLLKGITGSSVHEALTNPADQDDDSSRKVTCPECGGDGKTANQKQCPKCGGSGKVPNFGDSVLDHVASLHTAELDGPSPKMDKRKWTPQNVGDPEPGSEQHPTKRHDIVDVIKAENVSEHPLKEIGEQTTERQKLPAASADNSGFSTKQVPSVPSDAGGTWNGTGGQANPVT